MRIIRLGLSLCSSNRVGGLTPIELIVNAFKSRVIADGGVFEAQACLEAQLTILSNIE
jgi:hypothetical protein